MNKEQLQEKLDKQTKYSKYYLLIIKKAKQENRKKLNKDDSDYVYYENHHILPKSIFSEYGNLKENTWNSVLLTAREHYICHALIWKHYKSLNYREQYPMGRAFNLMTYVKDNNQKRYTSKLYEYFKINYKVSIETINKIKATLNNKSSIEKEVSINKWRDSVAKWSKDKKEDVKRKMSIAKQGKKLSPEHKKSIGEGNKGKTVSESSLLKAQKTREKWTDEQKEKNSLAISRATKGKIVSDETRSKWSKDNIGKKQSNETKYKKLLKRKESFIPIDVYNADGIIEYTCYWDFRGFCKDNNLPYKALSESYRNNGEPIYTSSRQIKFSIKYGYERFHLYYAKRRN